MTVRPKCSYITAFVMAICCVCTEVYHNINTVSKAPTVTHPLLLCRIEQSLPLRDLSFIWGFTGPRRSLLLCCRGFPCLSEAISTLDSVSLGQTSGTCHYPHTKRRQVNPRGHPLRPHESLRTFLLWLFAQIFKACTRNMLNFSSRPVCVHPEEDSSNIVQSMQALVRESFLVSLAAVIAER